ncbi:LysR family transcriptional regulator [Kitasatospora sp. NBC_01250]|uniref:LysR family transcriptional regulator n=1 Tax=Kitasatospora sp. NBC_01250 TaxID=2903571 RepID=UPI002E36849F|nr:LysR family transcriptional regulator [Kitasatospora sp. NBC_01250]
MELDPKRLMILRAIAEGGGVAAAARALGHTPSAVSQQLNRLERETGVPLVDRTGGRAELTASGRLLAQAGERIQQALTDATRELNALGEQAAGPVAIGVPATAISYFATTALHLLATAHPALQPRLVETGPAEGLRALRLGELDALVIADDQDAPTPLPPGVRATALLEDEYRLVLPDGWAEPADWAELSGRPWIGAPADSPRGVVFQRLAAEHGIVPSVQHVARYPFAVYSMLAARLGPAILTATAASRLTHGVVAGLAVPGGYVVRLLRRTGPSGAVPAVEATAEALQQAVLLAAERMAGLGLLEREPRVRPRLVDPSERTRTE